MEHYHHVTMEEREKLFMGMQAGLSLRELGRRLGRSHSTVLREIRRNRRESDGRYLPERAERAYRERRTGCRKWKLASDERLRRVVVAKLKQGWSPEQIAGRLKREGGEHRVSHETIYRYVYSEGGVKRELSRLLASRRERRRMRVPRSRGVIPGMVMVHDRPAIADDRSQPGHWEADLLCFRHHYTRAVTTLVERKSRYVALVMNPCKFTGVVMKGIRRRIKDLPHGSVATMTFDQGREFYRHRLLHRKGIATYFCEAGKPWQKGSVENANKRLRRFLPKRFNPHSITPLALGLIARKLNHTPRKCLNYATPNEVFFNQHQKSGALHT